MRIIRNYRETASRCLEGELPKDWQYATHNKDLDNPLLYRKTEQVLKAGFSVVAQSIGSQSTKGIAFLKALGAAQQKWGVWTKDHITLIETYPKACLLSDGFVAWIATLDLRQDVHVRKKPIKKKKGQEVSTEEAKGELIIQDDTFDAAVCACLARAFADKSIPLVHPPVTGSKEEKQEGWIFYPSGELVHKSLAYKHSKVTNSEATTSFAMSVKAFREHVASPKAKQPKPQSTEGVAE
jgi:hypothetical protein